MRPPPGQHQQPGAGEEVQAAAGRSLRGEAENAHGGSPGPRRLLHRQWVGEGARRHRGPRPEQGPGGLREDLHLKVRGRQGDLREGGVQVQRDRREEARWHILPLDARPEDQDSPLRRTEGPRPHQGPGDLQPDRLGREDGDHSSREPGGDEGDPPGGGQDPEHQRRGYPRPALHRKRHSQGPAAGDQEGAGPELPGHPAPPAHRLLRGG